MLTSAVKTSKTDPCFGDLRRDGGALGSAGTLTMYRSRATGCASVTGYRSSSRGSLRFKGRKLPVWTSTMRPPATTSATKPSTACSVAPPPTA